MLNFNLIDETFSVLRTNLPTSVYTVKDYISKNRFIVRFYDTKGNYCQNFIFLA